MSTFDGFIREFDGLVRADNFQQSDWLPKGCRSSMVYLLSHAHSDHMVGLDNFDGSRIYCSELTKAIVLKIRPVQARVNEANGVGNGKMDRTYKNLLPKAPGGEGLLEALQPYEPTEIPVNITGHSNCRVTLIPANHCPGSAMFLIQMHQLNVLYTGDIRAEPWWVESLTKEPQLAPFIVSPQGINYRLEKPPHSLYHQDEGLSETINQQTSSGSSNGKPSRPFTPLDNIYLDTSSLLTKLDVLTKEDAIKMTIEMMSAYPDDTKFFINSWTWGYEELLQRIIVHFKTFIHVDSYKHEIYTQPEFKKHFPLLSACITLDSQATRFHACERAQRRQQVLDRGRKFQRSQSIDSKTAIKGSSHQESRIVCVNPSEMTTQKWNSWKSALDIELAAATRYCSENPKSKHDPWPLLLLSPLTRHSSFKEILNFISAFRPKCIFPNTTCADTGFVEFYAIPKLFGSLLDSGAAQQIQKQTTRFVEDYESRHEKKLARKIVSIDLLDWKGTHFDRLEKFFSKYEQLAFKSPKFQSMWERFPTITTSDKHKAAKYLGGPSAKNLDDKTIEIESSDEERLSQSQTAAYDTEIDEETQQYQSSEMHGADSDEPFETPGFFSEGTHGEADHVPQAAIYTHGEASHKPQEAMGPQHSPRSMQIIPADLTSISRIPSTSPSTVKEDSSSFQDPPTSPSERIPTNVSESRSRANGFGLSRERRMLSKLAAMLQVLEHQRAIKASDLVEQHREYEQVLNHLEKYGHSGDSHTSKKRRQSIGAIEHTSDTESLSETSSSIIIIDNPKAADPKDPLLLIWAEVRNSIVKMAELREKISYHRKMAVEAIQRTI